MTAQRRIIGARGTLNRGNESNGVLTGEPSALPRCGESSRRETAADAALVGARGTSSVNQLRDHRDADPEMDPKALA